LKFYDTVDSTNLEAKRLIEQGEVGPLWISAARQTAGYGRRGSAWFQAEGDVAATLVFTAHESRKSLGQLSYVAALSVADAISTFIDNPPLSLKWPNDVLLNDAKVSGILLELVTQSQKPPVVVLGVGVNIISMPSEVDYAVARLMDLISDPIPSPHVFLKALDASFFHWFELWKRDGFEPVREAWLEKAARLNQPIKVQLPDKTLSGIFTGINQNGELILLTDEFETAIAAGAVFFGDDNATRH